jgi:hypothetical protein
MISDATVPGRIDQLLEHQHDDVADGSQPAIH